MTLTDALSQPFEPARPRGYARSHLLGIQGLTRDELVSLMDAGERYYAFNKSPDKKLDVLSGRTQLNVFFEASTRTQVSFEIAGKRLGADVVNFAAEASSLSKGESFRDTIATLNAMRPDVMVVRHATPGAPKYVADRVDCPVINAGDGAREHPTQALLDALAIRRAFGGVEGLVVAICGDIRHSRVARSNLLLLSTLGAEVRFVAPPSLLPASAERLTPWVFTDLESGLDGCDVVMALRLQTERMASSRIPSTQDYYARYGITARALDFAKPDAKVMHPGPMNRGVEIESAVADDPERSLIADQVEMGVAVRMAVLDALAGREARS